MDRYEVFTEGYENDFVVMKNDNFYARFRHLCDVEHFLSVLVESTRTMPAVDIEDDVFNEDWSRLFYRTRFFDGVGIKLEPFAE